MSTAHRCLVIVFLVVGSWLSAGRALAVAPEVKDEAKFFSPEAVKKANKEIREIARKCGKDLLIETFAAVPGEQTERVKDMSSEERAKFFHNWAVDRTEATVVNGIYIMICKEPAHLEIVITPNTRSVFNKQAYERLRETLVKNLREKKFDDCLEKAVEQVRDKLAADK